MGEGSTIGLDIAKSVFQIHGVEVEAAVVIRKRVSRAKLVEFFAALAPCLVGIEACLSAHYWSRRLGALGHTVRLLPPAYVKAYLKRSKNDANDAAAICEAVIGWRAKPSEWGGRIGPGRGTHGLHWPPSGHTGARRAATRSHAPRVEPRDLVEGQA